MIPLSIRIWLRNMLLSFSTKNHSNFGDKYEKGEKMSAERSRLFEATNKAQLEVYRYIHE
jgi:hypothetical protein